jgi:hypothetical protein
VTRVAYILAVLTGVALAFALAGCAEPPLPPVPPGPAPADVFAGAIIDCAAPEVDQGMVRTDAAVRGCLTGTATASCLAALYPGETINVVACTVRELGISANIRVLRSDVRTEDTTIDSAARAWIKAEGIGYR